MKQSYTLAAMFVCAASLSAVAQEQADSLASDQTVEQLQEFVIEAPRVVHKADMMRFTHRKVPLKTQKTACNWCVISQYPQSQ